MYVVAERDDASRHAPASSPRSLQITIVKAAFPPFCALLHHTNNRAFPVLVPPSNAAGLYSANAQWESPRANPGPVSTIRCPLSTTISRAGTALSRSYRAPAFLLRDLKSTDFCIDTRRCIVQLRNGNTACGPGSRRSVPPCRSGAGLPRCGAHAVTATVIVTYSRFRYFYFLHVEGRGYLLPAPRVIPG